MAVQPLPTPGINKTRPIKVMASQSYYRNPNINNLINSLCNHSIKLSNQLTTKMRQFGANLSVRATSAKRTETRGEISGQTGDLIPFIKSP